ncbi:MAG TPA: replication protein [Chloroflexia bacterium]|nr:replication protein [Chloroflexia bacterium]
MSGPASTFHGYGQPTFTAIPDLFLDHQMQDLTKAELKVMLYIFRHTYGFQKHCDAISYSQFVEGITTRDGRRLDRGAGVSERSVVRALDVLVERGLIFRHYQLADNSGFRVTIYELNIDGEPHWQAPGASQITTPPAKLAEPSRNYDATSPVDLAVPSRNYDATPPVDLAVPPSVKIADTKNIYKQNTSIQHTSKQHTLLCDDDVAEEMLETAGMQSKAVQELSRLAAKNGRDATYLQAWQRYIAGQESIANPQAYLRRVVSENADPPAALSTNAGSRVCSYQEQRRAQTERLVASARKYGLI